MAVISCKPFGFDSLKARLQSKLAQRDDSQPREEVLQQLRSEGLALVAHARENKAFTDRTGNLVSSIGYAIYFNGTQLETYVGERVYGSEHDTENRNPQAITLSALQTWATNHPDKIAMHGYTLIIVAGMEYGRYVEAKGYNVIYLSAQKGIGDMSRIKEALKQAHLI